MCGNWLWFEELMSVTTKPLRTAWGNFPDVLIHASESAVKQHPAYQRAKSGHGPSATALVNDTMSEPQNQRLIDFLHGHTPTLVSAHAYERQGINAIPEAFAVEISKAVGWPHDMAVAQINVVEHTGADGFPAWRDKPNLQVRFKPVANTYWWMTSWAWVARWPT